MNAISGLGNALRALWANPTLLIFSAMIDAAFFIVYGFFTQPVRDQLFNNAVLLTNVVGEALQQAGQRFETPSVLSMLTAPLAKPHFIGVILWLLVLMVVGYVLYVIFQGIAWRLALQHKRKGFMTQFALLNIPWFIIVGTLYFLLTVIDLRSAIVLAITKESASAIPRSIILGLISLSFYFAIISYGQLHSHGWKKAFKLSFSHGIGKIVKYLPPAALLAIIYIIVNFLLVYLFRINQALGFIIGIILFLPLLYLSRIYIYKIVRDEHGIHKHS